MIHGESFLSEFPSADFELIAKRETHGKGFEKSMNQLSCGMASSRKNDGLRGFHDKRR
jgi:hypothetical protein